MNFPEIDLSGVFSLPKCTQEQDRIKRLKINLIDFKDVIAPKKDELISLKGSYALRWIDQAIADYGVGKLDVAEPSFDFKEKLEKAVRLREFSGIEHRSAEQLTILSFLAELNRVKFSFVREWIAEADTGFTEVALEEYLYLLPVMSMMDRLYIKMIFAKQLATEEREAHGFNNEFAIAREHDGKPVELLFHEAYPEEIGFMAKQYEDLILQLKTIDSPLSEKKQAYYSSVALALRTGHKDHWMDADTRIAGQIDSLNDVIHIHIIETGYMADRIVRAPEVSLRCPDLAESQANSMAQETKGTMLESMKSDYLWDIPNIQESYAYVEKSNAALRHFLGGGSALDFKAAGQVLPNDPTARANGGVDASLDMTTVKDRHPLAEKAFLMAFSQELYDEQFEKPVDFDYMVGSYVSSHECGHPVGNISDTAVRIGPSLMYSFIEEWKASVAGIITNLYIPFKQGKLPVQVLKKQALIHVMTACRYASMRAQAGAYPYFRKSVMLMKVAEDVGMVYQGDGGWTVAVDYEKYEAFFDSVFQQFREILEIYGKGTGEDLSSWLNEHLKQSDLMAHIMDSVDRGFGSENPPIETYLQNS